jgi:hypothetical protein
MNKKWTNNKPYERSRRLKHVEQLENEQFTKEVESNAYMSSLNYDENTWDILNQTHAGGFTISNKREELDSKIADRELIQQRGFNPFLDNNYVEDVAMRDKYLKPLNSNINAHKDK